MNIQFINHACIRIQSGPINLICDPWLEGNAFHNGWSLLADTEFKYEDFINVTHIWFSHEHPDHFSPPNLMRIPQDCRQRIVVLFQSTVDRKVASFCRKLGFKEIIELYNDCEYELSSSFKILCNSYTDGDSYASFQVEGFKLLNLNDCIVNSREAAEEIRKKVGHVDWLFTQFGYANKIGNTLEVEKRKMASLEKLQRIKYQIEVFQPSVVIPFASFIYFSHVENSYLNDGANDIEVVYDFISNIVQTPCVVLYPNDLWNGDRYWNSTQAIKKYQSDCKRKVGKNLIQSDVVEKMELVRLSQYFVEKLKIGFPHNSRDIKKLSSIIYITDYNEKWELKGSVGLIKSRDDSESNWDIQVGSDALSYCFKELWGGETLRINGRFQSSSTYNRFRQFTDIASALNRSERYPYLSKKQKILLKVKSLFKL